MKILIVEDEAVVAQRLTRLLLAILGGDRIESLRHVEDLYQALDYISKHPIDLLFLDLNLNGEDGFRILTEAAAGAFQTIIVSAYSDQAIRAFEFGVIDFVPKPYTEQRLRKALDRTVQRDNSLREQTKFLAVREDQRIRILPVSDIVYIQGADDYSEVHCTDGSRWLHDKSLQELSLLLPAAFMRIHRSYLLQLTAVDGYESLPGSRYRAVLKNGERLPVSRRRIEELRKRMKP